MPGTHKKKKPKGYMGGGMMYKKGGKAILSLPLKRKKVKSNEKRIS